MGLFLVAGAVDSHVKNAVDMLCEQEKFELLYVRSLSEAFSIIRKNGAELLLADARTLCFPESQSHDSFIVGNKGAGRNAIRAIRAYVRNHYAEELSLGRLSKQFGLTQNYLGSLFKKEYGLSLVDYIAGVRLQRAAYLLLSTNMKVKDIAKEVGYKHCSYFCKLFLSVYGKKPTEYRIHHQTEEVRKGG